jgi:peptide/nickel transport system substrate-binding protein
MLHIAIPQDPKTLDPLLASNTFDGLVIRLLFEPLISADARGNDVPILAAAVPTLENGGISPNGLTITYHLRPGIRWTDGVPVTSRDVRFSWQTIENRDNNAVSHVGYDDVRALDTPNAVTVVVHLKKRFAPFVDTFFAESDQPYNVVPAHALARYKTINTIPFNDGPNVSDGPFKFVRWAHGDRVVLAANDDFFLGKPKLAGIVVETIANENTSVTLLRTHAIQFMAEASVVLYPLLHDIPGVRLAWHDANGYEGIGFNLRRRPMSDPRFRLAVAQAIDKRELVRALTFGQEQIAVEDLPAWMWASNPSLHSPPYDPAAARALLKEAGVKTPVSLVLVTDSANALHEREAVLIQSMLRRVGIETEVKTYPGDLLYAPAGAGGILMSGDFDLALWPWIAGIDPDDSSQFTCANVPPNGWNQSGYCNPRMDALQRVALTQYRIATRTAAYHAIEALLNRDNPELFFWYQRMLEPVSTAFHGFSPNPVTESWNAWQWSVR